MTNRPRTSIWKRIAGWLSVLAWLTLVGFSVIGAFDVFAVGGWSLLIGCFFWSIAVWSGFIWFIIKRLERLEGASGARIGLGLLGVSFVSTAIAPGIAAGIKWGPDAGTGIALIGTSGFFCAVIVILVVHLPQHMRHRRVERIYSQFESKFEDGPIGVWRADLPRCNAEPDAGCRLVVNADGTGSVRQWETKANELELLERPFRWRLVKERVIEVDDGLRQPSLPVCFQFLWFGDEAHTFARLLLHRVGARQLWVESDSGIDVPGEGWWPAFYFFAYHGEPPTSRSIEPRAA